MTARTKRTTPLTPTVAVVTPNGKSIENRIYESIQLLALISAAASAETHDDPVVETADILEAIANAAADAIYLLKPIQHGPAAALNWTPPEEG